MTANTSNKSATDSSRARFLRLCWRRASFFSAFAAARASALASFFCSRSRRMRSSEVWQGQKLGTSSLQIQGFWIWDPHSTPQPHPKPTYTHFPTHTTPTPTQTHTTPTHFYTHTTPTQTHTTPTPTHTHTHNTPWPRKCATLPRVPAFDHANPWEGSRVTPKLLFYLAFLRLTSPIPGKGCNFTSRSVARPGQSIVKIDASRKNCHFTTRSDARPGRSIVKIDGGASRHAQNV